MDITPEKYQELIEAKVKVDILTKALPTLVSYRFVDLCKMILVPKEDEDAE